jgi:hypothetical protein
VPILCILRTRASIDDGSTWVRKKITILITVFYYTHCSLGSLQSKWATRM